MPILERFLEWIVMPFLRRNFGLVNQTPASLGLSFGKFQNHQKVGNPTPNPDPRPESLQP